jgi:GNAT superfamily N-acetyltransferase
MDPSRNPNFEPGDAAFYVAWRGRQPVGTVGVAIDRRANALSGIEQAAFGFFECVDEYGVAKALLDRAAAWARERGMELLRGPQSFGGSDEPGLLIEGRETAPALLQGWTPPYYTGFVERYGFLKHSDTLAYRAVVSDYTDETGQVRIPERIVRIAEHVRRRYGYEMRQGDLTQLEREMAIALGIYNQALGTLPEFVPLSEAEWARQAEMVRPLLDGELIAFAEVEGKPVGFALALPDINQALIHCNGLRYPWDYLKLWWYSRRITGVSFKILAMLPEYWGRGLDALLYLQIAQVCLVRGIEWVDMSLTGEDNPTTNRLAHSLGAKLDKRYRIYQLEL